MKIKYFGTGAAEGIPALFCLCDVCKNARILKGKDYRTRAQALVNDDLLIDFGPDTYYHVLNHDLPLEYINDILITHSHDDHLYPFDLTYRKKRHASRIVDEPLHIYSGKASYDMIKDIIDENCSDELELYDLNEITPFKPFKVNNYQVTALDATHEPTTSPVIYYIEEGEKSMLYAHDTGYFPLTTMEFLSKISKPLNFISLDCTSGLIKGYRKNGRHLSLENDLEVLDNLKKINAIDDNTIVAISHISHNGLGNHKELVNEASKYNIIVAYDGMEIEF